jgi:DNA-binding transcriptional LysR family regulator
VFAVAPSHPLAGVEGRWAARSCSSTAPSVVADSARKMAPRTVGLLLGQDTLTVPDMQAKLEYQLAGMGFGFLPEACAAAAIAAGLLVEKQVEERRRPKPSTWPGAAARRARP